MIDDRHDSNQELMAQGLANMAGEFWWYARHRHHRPHRHQCPTEPARRWQALCMRWCCWSFCCCRAADAAYSAGGLSAVLVVVRCDGEWAPVCPTRTLAQERRGVFSLRLHAHGHGRLPVAVGVSLVLASAFLVKRLSDSTQVTPDEDVTQSSAPGQTTTGRVIPDGVLVFRVFGAFFFGARTSGDVHRPRRGLPEILILRMA